jgi:hypothetical protein
MSCHNTNIIKISYTVLWTIHSPWVPKDDVIMQCYTEEAEQQLQLSAHNIHS